MLEKSAGAVGLEDPPFPGEVIPAGAEHRAGRNSTRARGELSSFAAPVHYRPSALVLRRARGVVPRTNEVGPDIRERTGSGQAVAHGPFMPRPCRPARPSGEDGVPVGPPLAPPDCRGSPPFPSDSRSRTGSAHPAGGRTPDRAPPPHPSASQPSAEASELGKRRGSFSMPPRVVTLDPSSAEDGVPRARATVTRQRTPSTRAGRFGATASEFICIARVLRPEEDPRDVGTYVGSLIPPARRVASCRPSTIRPRSMKSQASQRRSEAVGLAREEKWSVTSRLVALLDWPEPLRYRFPAKILTVPHRVTTRPVGVLRPPASLASFVRTVCRPSSGVRPHPLFHTDCPSSACAQFIALAIRTTECYIPSHVEKTHSLPIVSPTAVTANGSARNPEKSRGGEGGVRGVVHSAMSSQAVDCNALEAMTSVEDITGNEHSRDILRALQNDELSQLWLCRPDLATEFEDYELGSSRELDWLGHFAKKSTSLESIGVIGIGTFGNCSEHSVDRFLDDLGKCNHIKKMTFTGLPAEFIHKLGPAMKNSSRTHFVVDECNLGVPEATFLFNTFRGMNSLKVLCIDGNDGEGLTNLNDGDMAGCIPSLAACMSMRSLNLNYLNVSTNSCAALRGVLPQMTALLELVLRGNSLDDDCTRLLAQGLTDCKQIQSLDLSHNRISDDGLDVLIQGLPTSVDVLYLSRNDIVLARHVLLLRFRELNIGDNTLCPGGTGVIVASLANPECRLEDLHLSQCNIGDEGAAILADGLRNNQRLTHMSLGNNNITDRGWNAFSSILCDASSTNATYNSNHTLQDLGDCQIGDDVIPQDIKMMLHLNNDKNKSHVAANKILRAHRHLDMRPLFGRDLGLLPHVVAWLEHFAKSRPGLKLSLIFEFVRAMPMKVTDGVVGKAKGEKRNLNS
ncbi:hypothetical protein THAOC_34284 [Thalassiosira oceanica]|uniref:Uncharacterized protein n=1 Tax=Thalassiosira oceanica TaxID=159749 RepID=K0R5A3_THAOC|nr:hypothetical protein THAOC_34284 [Thalassiosira oceanica]|eukprot:EJK47024.1 hypothetical protein THAOC_34284 [Thalassiosira oceanica]